MGTVTSRGTGSTKGNIWEDAQMLILSVESMVSCLPRGGRLPRSSEVLQQHRDAQKMLRDVVSPWKRRASKRSHTLSPGSVGVPGAEHPSCCGCVTLHSRVPIPTNPVTSRNPPR